MLRSQSVLIGLAFLAGASLAICQESSPTPSLLQGASSLLSVDRSASASSASSNASETGITKSDAADKLLAEAESHFNSGRQFYFQNNSAGARREFDAAIDVLLSAPDSMPDHQRVEHRLNEMCDLIYRFDIEKLGAGQQEEADVVFDKAPIDEVSHMTFPVDPAMSAKLKSEVNQTASGIPLELSEPVLSYVHFFSTDRGRSILLSGFKRSGRYRPLIERIFAEEHVPQELIYLAQAESGFLPRAVSRKSAVGMWQFIAGTGSTYDLVHTSTFDERLDPEKATRAAARFLKDLYARYGDWYLAMAAYNCGAGAVDRAVERTGYADYWELLKRHALPRETSNYVPIIVAMTIMAKNSSDYGLTNVELDQPVQYDSIQLTAATSLYLIADATLQPVSVIQDLNPSLLKTVVPAGFQVHIPSGSSQTAQAALETVPSENRKAWRLHHVENGDTLAAIAKSYHLPAERIVAVNKSAVSKRTDSLEAGDVLLIPAVYHEEKPAIKRGPRTRSRNVRSSSHGTGLRATHVAASRRVPGTALHRRPAVRNAS